MTAVPGRATDTLAPFHHFAAFYANDDEYVSAAAPFIESGVEAGEAALVAVPTARIELLHGALSARARRVVEFRSMETLGRNPAWIIPAWADFLRDHAGEAVRGVGEPVWAGRTGDELAECARHETLLNLAFADVAGFSLLCPYDVSSLEADVVAEARRTHPSVVEGGAERPSPAYRGMLPLDVSLPPAPANAERRGFTDVGVVAVREWAADRAAAFGLPHHRVNDLRVSVSEAVTNSVLHGGGGGTLSIWADGGHIVCEVRDSGHIDEPLAGRVRPSINAVGGRGLWIVNQLCDLVQVRPVDGGQVVRFRLLCR